MIATVDGHFYITGATRSNDARKRNICESARKSRITGTCPCFSRSIVNSIFAFLQSCFDPGYGQFFIFTFTFIFTATSTATSIFAVNANNDAFVSKDPSGTLTPALNESQSDSVNSASVNISPENGLPAVSTVSSAQAGDSLAIR